MAENAKKDQNNSYSLIVVGPDGETKRLKGDSAGNLFASLGTALDKNSDSITTFPKGLTKTKKTASGFISAFPTLLCGYYIASAVMGTITFYDNPSAASGDTFLANMKSVNANDYVILNSPVLMTDGLYLAITGAVEIYVLTREIGV